jgi:hypothetical protein
MDPSDPATPNASAPTAERSSPDAWVPGGDRSETPDERLDRELGELLQELRVALPGVQVVFAFLLTVPFTDRFHELDTVAKDVYLAAMVLMGTTSLLLIAPTVHHRLRFRTGTKHQMITTANRFAVVGMVLMALGFGCASYVAAEAALPGTWARWLGPIFVVVAAILWLLVPFTFAPRAPTTSPTDPSAPPGGGDGRASR